MHFTRIPFAALLLRCIIFCHIFLFFSVKANSQTLLFTEGFETTFPPGGWTIQNYTASANYWQQYSGDKYAGIYSAACYPYVANANSWLFTKALNLQAGKYYVLGYYYKIQSATALKVTIGNNPGFLGQLKVLHSNFPSSTSFALAKDTFVCEQTGTYYFGFNNYSNSTFDCGALIDDVSFTELDNFPACGNTVTAGTISSSVPTACVNASFSITANNTTSNTSGVKYAWQKSPDGINWSNITNGYVFQPSIVVSQGASTYYRLTDTCVATGASAISNQLLVSMSPYLNCYCTPAFVNCVNGLSFTNVTIVNSTINNTSACSPNGYGNFVAAGNANVYRNQSIYIQHSISNPNNYPYTVGVWADINHNGIFDDNEFSLNGPFTTTINNSQFLVPAAALTGETRLRIRVRAFGNVLSSEACAIVAQNGETEDYKITIGDATSCNGIVSAGTISAVAQTCPNNNFTITTTGATVYQSQMRYAWQRSNDNINWINITNTDYLINPLTTSENSNTYYRLTDTCLATGATSVSNAVSVATGSIFNCYCIPQSSICTNSGIDSVSFNTIHNGSGCGTGGYSNFTSISTTVNNGSNLPFYIKVRSASFSTAYAGIWIDYNRNGSFETNERVFTGTTTSNGISGIINIPFNVKSGETAMRVIVSSSSLSTPCTSIFIGETEDYRIVLNVANPVANKFTYYVKQAATGSNDGTSWTNAFTSLATAFSLLTTGDTIKVAKGSYTAGSTNASSFQLKDSVVILGGYPDTGNPTDADRNFSNFQTVMNGEIGSSTILTDNTKTILRATVAKGFLVDGFIIENCFNGPVANNFGIVSFTSSTGTMKNTVIRKNYADPTNGAINIVDTKLTLLNNFIESNESITSYGDARLLNISAKSDVAIINSVIAKNKTSSILNQSYSTVKILNSTFFKNYGFSSVHDTSNLIVQNAIFHNNGNNFNTDTAEFKKDIYSSISLSNTITEVYNTSSSNYLGGNPKFIDSARIAGADNKYFSADDGLRVINPCSPAINAGNNNFVAAVPTDIAGNTRIKNGIVDLGAYEVQETLNPVPAVLYVNKTATGLNNGSSWQNAFTDLQSAFYYCSDTVKVAKGSYPVSTTDTKASFRLSNHRVIMGGFPNTGSPANSDINTILNPTQIDGKVNTTENCQTLITSINNDSTARMIGFELINAAAPLLYTVTDYAAVKIAYKSSPYFEDIRINALTNSSGIIIGITDQSKPKFYRSAFYNGFNRQGTEDGTREISVSNNSSPYFIKCYIGRDTTAPATTDVGTGISFLNAAGSIDSCFFFRARHDVVQTLNSSIIVSNTTFTKGLGRSIFNRKSTPLVINCVFNDTSYNYYNEHNGGAVANTDNSNATYIKCRFYNSYTYRYGGACSNEYSTTLFKNCVFKNCRASFGAGTILNKAGRLTLLNCIGYNSSTGQGSSFPQSQFLDNDEGSVASIINSTILTNTTTGNRVIGSGTTDTLKIYNSIIWRYGFSAQMININDDISTANNNNAAICDIRNSMLFRQENTALTNSFVGIAPRLTDLTNIEGVDNTLYTSDDAFIPCSCSPAVNGGNNNLNPETADILGLNRIYNGTIDIGAYELQSNATSEKTFYVKENAAPGGTGVSWNAAYNNLQKAVLNNCADTIKIAKGIYKPAILSRDSSFNIYKGTTILGGYPNTGNPTDAERNVNTNPTVLSGDIGVANDSTDNSYIVMQIHCPDTTVLIDGLTIERANNNMVSPTTVGGGSIEAKGNKLLTIKNCILQNSYAPRGGGLYSVWSTLNVLKTVIRNNNSLPQNSGGGFYVQDVYMVVNGNGWTPLINFKNSVLTNNKGGAGYISGTGVISNQGLHRFENVVVYKNEAASGAGFSFSGHAYVTIVNSIFAKNNNTNATPGIGILTSNPYYGNGLHTYVHNSIFAGNTVMGMQSNYVNSDFNWHNSNTQQETIPAQNLTYSTAAGNQTGSGSGNIYTIPTFLDIENGAGSDNIWMTPDDGLQVNSCAATVDNGSNAYVQNIPLDILDSVRIRNVRVDMGPYEKSSYIPVTPVATITASDTIVCTGTTVTFYASGITGVNNASTYQWKLNGANVGTNTPIYVSPNIPNGAVVNVVVTINNPCVSTQTVTSNSITIQSSSSVPASVSIASSANPSCSGSNVIFTAVPVLGGSNPGYQWKVNGVNAGTTNSTFFMSNALKDNDVVSVVMTSTLPCVNNNPVTSNPVTVRVNPIVQPAVTITAGSIGCPGSSVTLTANGVNGGNSPFFQWKLNGANVGANSSSYTSTALNENDVLTVTMTSSITCVTTATVTSASYIIHYTTVVTPSVTITAPSTNTCAGAAISFTATAINGGSNPAYQWQVNGVNTGSNSNIFTTSNLQNNSQVKVILTSNAGCITTNTATSNTLVITVNQPINPAITISGNTTINLGQSSLITAAVVNAGASPSYQWQDSTATHNWLTINGAGNSSLNYAAVNTGNKLRCIVTNNTTCSAVASAISNVLTFTVNGGFAGSGATLRLFPNPATSSFTIDTLRLSNLWSSIEITAVDGKLVIGRMSIANKISVTIDVSGLVKGLYFAVLRKEDGERVYIKFVKQ